MLPIIKWAGGKRQLLPELRKRVPESFSKYAEPFLGSGALFFDLAPADAVINDINPELVNFYLTVKNDSDTLITLCERYQSEYNALPSGEQSEYYYARRTDFNKHIVSGELDTNDAALLLFLNKACYNGLYRVNSNGLYNTPFGKRKCIKLAGADSISACSDALKKTTILCGDFEDACSALGKGDFVYFDSPYYDTFDTYQAGGFPKEEHERLSNLFKRLSDKGVFCMLSNSDTDYIKNLYSGFNICIVPVKRMINCDGSKRTGTEVIVTNY